MPRGYTVALMTPEDAAIYRRLGLISLEVRRTEILGGARRDMKVMDDAENDRRYLSPRTRALRDMSDRGDLDAWNELVQDFKNKGLSW